jgi:hypothetical protein
MFYARLEGSASHVIKFEQPFHDLEHLEISNKSCFVALSNLDNIRPC